MDESSNSLPIILITEDSRDPVCVDTPSSVSSLCIDNVSSQDLRFLDHPMDASNMEFNGYTAELLYGDDSVSISPVEFTPSVSKNFRDAVFADTPSAVSSLCMDNVSSQDLRFLDHPMDASHMEFNGYTAEQLYGDDSVSISTIEFAPSVTENFIDASCVDTPSSVSSLFINNVSSQDLRFLDQSDGCIEYGI